jgi:hypothetical protein
MHWRFEIPQLAIVENGLLEKVSLRGVALLHYLLGWQKCKRAERITVDGRKFVWLDYAHAVSKIPMLFSPRAGMRTKINALGKLMGNLRTAELIETRKRGPRLFFFLTPAAERLFLRNRHSDTENCESPDTKMCISPDTEKRDRNAPPYIDETGTNEKEDQEEAPIVPKGVEIASLAEIKESVLRCVNHDPRRELSAYEQRMLERASCGFTRGDLRCLEQLYNASDNRDEPCLLTRKKKFTTIVRNLPEQIGNARKLYPPPRPPKPEPTMEELHRWLQRKYPSCVLGSWAELPGSVKDEFLKEHPEHR